MAQDDHGHGSLRVQVAVVLSVVPVVHMLVGVVLVGLEDYCVVEAQEVLGHLALLVMLARDELEIWIRSVYLDSAVVYGM